MDEMKEAAEVGKESNDSIIGEHLLAWKDASYPLQYLKNKIGKVNPGMDYRGREGLSG